jgi:hypothetical protein
MKLTKNSEKNLQYLRDESNKPVTHRQNKKIILRITWFWTSAILHVLETTTHIISETDPVFETLCFLVSRIPDDGKRAKIQ